MSSYTKLSIRGCSKFVENIHRGDDEYQCSKCKFLIKCGTNPKGFNKESAKRVDSILTQLAQTAESQQGQSSTEPQNVFTKTTNYFLRSHSVTADDFTAAIQPTSDDDKCNKVCSIHSFEKNTLFSFLQHICIAK